MKKARPVARIFIRRAGEHPTKVAVNNPSLELPVGIPTTISLLARVAPSLAAWALDRLWFTPPRPRISTKALAILNRYSRIELDVRGRRVAAWTAGAGKAIVLMHGWGGYGAQLSQFVAPLVAAGFRVIVFDGLGHGASAASPLGIRQSSFLDFANAIEVVAKSHGPIFGIVAHSGGAVATLLALRAHVSLERLVLVAPLARPSLYAARFTAQLGLDRGLLKRWLARSERRIGFRFADLDLVAAPRELKLPTTLVVHDRDDPEVPFAEGQAVADAWPEATLHTTSKLGHRQLLRDSAVIARVTVFFSNNSGSPAF